MATTTADSFTALEHAKVYYQACDATDFMSYVTHWIDIWYNHVGSSENPQVHRLAYECFMIIHSKIGEISRNGLDDALATSEAWYNFWSRGREAPDGSWVVHIDCIDECTRWFEEHIGPLDLVTTACRHGSATDYFKVCEDMTDIAQEYFTIANAAKNLCDGFVTFVAEGRASPEILTAFKHARRVFQSRLYEWGRHEASEFEYESYQRALEVKCWFGAFMPFAPRQLTIRDALTEVDAVLD